MTIFHALKYDVDKSITQWLTTDTPWTSLFPEEIVNKIRAGFPRSSELTTVTLRCMIERVLLEYEGPLE